MCPEWSILNFQVPHPILLNRYWKVTYRIVNNICRLYIMCLNKHYCTSICKQTLQCVITLNTVTPSGSFDLRFYYYTLIFSHQSDLQTQIPTCKPSKQITRHSLVVKIVVKNQQIAALNSGTRTTVIFFQKQHGFTGTYTNTFIKITTNELKWMHLILWHFYIFRRDVNCYL